MTCPVSKDLQKENKHNQLLDCYIAYLGIVEFVFYYTYLRCFYTCFPKKEIKHNVYNNQWITQGIKISYKRKRVLILLSRHCEDLNLKMYYKLYCKVLSKSDYCCQEIILQ